MVRLEAKNIGHRYGDLTVLEGITFAVEEGRVLAVIGPSGCGKSTLLRILGGLVAPGAGEVLARGEAPANSSRPQRASASRTRSRRAAASSALASSGSATLPATVRQGSSAKSWNT